MDNLLKIGIPTLTLHSHPIKKPGRANVGNLVQDLQVTIWFRLEVGFVVMMNPDKTILTPGSITCASGRYSNSIRTLAYDQRPLREENRNQVTDVLTGPK